MKALQADAKGKWLIAVVLLLALVLRGSGTFRGLPYGVSFHPDAAKQVQALDEYLEGKYVWYTGLRFYDSYPLFLNHFDEWMIRGAAAVVRPAADYLGFRVGPFEPSTDTLYYWTMALRGLYGVAVVWLTWRIGRRLGLPPSAALAAMVLVAVSPLNIIVSHYATGDIACDLFFALTALCLARHAGSGRAVWLAVAGVMAGWTFAGKYNGGMAAFLIAGYALLLSLRGSRRVVRFAGMGVLSLGGFLVGVVSAMPQFLWARKRTWTDMLRVFEHVKNYRAPEDYLALPAWERAWIAFTQNAGGMAQALGIILLLAALAGLVWAIRNWRRANGADPAAAETRCSALRVALFAFPWLVLILSLASKLNLHAFYFSWIYPALALAAVAAVAPLAARPNWGRLVFGLAGVALLAPAAARLPQEIYFWVREDVRTVSRIHENDPVLPATRNERYRGPGRHNPSPNAIRDLLLEPRSMPTFRNRWGRIASPEARAWRRLAVLPLPVIPFGGPLVDWIAWNGPALPRSDWMFKVDPRRPVDVIILSFEPLENVRLGFQTGTYPAQVAGRWGGADVHARLGANDWTVVPLRDLQPVRVLRDTGRSDLDIYHYRLRLRADSAPVWATLLKSDAEADVFRLFGGDPEADLPGLMAQIDPAALADMVGRIRYRTGDGAGQRLPSGKSTALDLWNMQEVLPAGPYRLRVRVLAPAAGAVVRLALRDDTGRAESLGVTQDTELAPGGNDLELAFEKPFAPFQCTVTLELLSGEAWLGEWSLRPDVPALAAAANASEPPAWRRKFAAGPAPANVHAVETTFGGKIKVHEVAWPDPIVPGQSQPFHVRISLLEPLRHVDEYQVFIHLCDAAGYTLAAVHLPVRNAAFETGDALVRLRDLPAELASPAGVVRIGVMNARTLVRLPVTDHPADIPPPRRAKVEVGAWRAAAAE